MEKTIQSGKFSLSARIASKSAVKKPAIMSLVSPPEAEVSDQELMRRTQQGDSAAFSELYGRYSTAILSFLYRFLGNMEDVEAIGQEVFLRAYRFRSTYQYPQRLSTWLFTIARNLAINQSRRRKRNPVRNVTELNLEGIEMCGCASRVASDATRDAEKKEE